MFDKTVFKNHTTYERNQHKENVNDVWVTQMENTEEAA